MLAAPDIFVPLLGSLFRIILASFCKRYSYLLQQYNKTFITHLTHCFLLKDHLLPVAYPKLMSYKQKEGKG